MPQKLIIQAKVVKLHPAMRVFADSFIVSNQGQNYTVSELHHCILCISIVLKMIVTASKRYIVVLQLDWGFFSTFVAKR